MVITLILMKRIFLSILLLISSFTACFSQSTQDFFDEADALFGTYVANGMVDYEGLHGNLETLNNILAIAKNIKITTSKADTYKAFWINAYNLAVLKGILDVYPTTSPLDTKGFFDKKKFNLGGLSLTLNDIENNLLRAKFDEPRFHFVLVCGAKGCPPLISKAYRPAELEMQLQQQTVKALNNDAFIRVSDGKVMVSEIFKWYREDFRKEGQSEIDFLNKYRKVKIPANAKLSFYNYDWRLNSK